MKFSIRALALAIGVFWGWGLSSPVTGDE